MGSLAGGRAMTYRLGRGVSVENSLGDTPLHGAVRDNNTQVVGTRLNTIDDFIRQEGAIDAFTALIFEHYTPERQAPL
jgi:hypothetical protein